MVEILRLICYEVRIKPPEASLIFYLRNIINTLKFKIMNIKEDYISFETAKLLKEKGFNEKCRTFYTDKTSKITYIDSPIGNEKPFNLCVLAPTHQMVLKWLREKCDIYVEIVFYSSTKPVLYRWCASKNGRVVSDNEKPNTNVVKCFIHGDDINFTVHYCTYEDAVEAAIKYCLTNLI